MKKKLATILRYCLLASFLVILVALIIKGYLLCVIVYVITEIRYYILKRQWKKHWVHVENRKPERNKEFLFLTWYGSPCIGVYYGMLDGSHVFLSAGNIIRFTLWMPIPEP